MLYSENELNKRLKAGCGLYYFYASDEALVHNAAQKALKFLNQDDPETTVLDGPTPAVEEIVLAAGTISFFGGRLVLMPLVRPSTYSDKDLQELCDTLSDTENAIFVMTSVVEESYGKLRPGKREQKLIAACEKLGYCVQITKPGRAALQEMARTWAGEYHTTFAPGAEAALLDRCGDQVLMEHPTALLVLMRRMFTWGQIPRMQQLKALLLESVRNHPDMTPRQRGNLLGECDLIESFLHYNDITEMSRLHRSASRQMTDQAVSIQSRGSWTFGSPSVLMMFHRTPGQLSRELAEMDDCMPHYYKITGGHGMGAQRIMEGEAALAQGRLNDAAIALERARAAISGSGQENMALCCDFLEMRLHMAAGEAVGVDLRRRRQLLQQHNAMWLHIFDSTAAYCQAVLGRADDIPELFREHRLDTVNFLGPCLPMMQMIENQVYLAQGAYARVIGGSEGLLALCRGMHYALVELYVLTQTAAAYERLGKRREAAALVRQAADMAWPDGLVLPFAACYRYLRELLPEYGTLGREAAELSRVLEQGTQQEQRPAAFAPLTEREWAVAQRMARRLSNREIAGQLFLTEGTVKQYINQIYSKLHLTGDARTKRRRLEELMGE